MMYTPKQLVFIVLWLAFCFGMTLSPALISISMGLMALLGILSFKSFEFTRRDKVIALCSVLLFLSGAFSYFYSENTEEAFRKIVLKLPLLLLPFLIQALKQNKAIQSTLLLVFSYSVYLPGIVSVYNYVTNKTLFDQLILESKPLPVEFGYGIYHIQFSILMALAIVIGIYYCIERFKEKNSLLYKSIAILTFFNIVFIHILSARTGLLGCYAGILIIAIDALRKAGKKTFFISLSVGILVPVIMVFLSSSLQNRLRNSITDLQVVMQHTNPNDYSFAMRVEAWKNAVNVIKQSPLSGVGIGDAEKVLQDNFEHFNPAIEKDNRKNPHFQLLESAVQSGLPALILLLFLFIYGIGSGIKPMPLSAAIITLLFLSSCFESILERQASVAAFAVFIAWSLSYQRSGIKEVSIAS